MSKQISRSKLTLSTPNFSLQANQASYESPVAIYTVPPRKVYEIPNNFIRLKLATKQTFTFSTGSGETTQTLTTTYPIVEDPSFSNPVGTSVVLNMTTPATGEWTSFTVTQPNTISVTGLTGSTSYVINAYYLFQGGEAKITVVSSDLTTKSDILTYDIGQLDILNQEDVRYGLKPGVSGMVVAERFQIQVRVNSAAPICLYGASETAYSSPFARMSYIDLKVEGSMASDWEAAGTNPVTFAKSTMQQVA
jgi:hypothetical protein